MGREQRANAERREKIHKVADEMAGHFVDRGKIIEIGFASMIEMTFPDWKQMPKEQLLDLRMAFFGGAQHLFGSIMGILDPGQEPTERDLLRLELINHELMAFIEEFKQRHGITDPDIGPEPQTRQ